MCIQAMLVKLLICSILTMGNIAINVCIQGMSIKPLNMLILPMGNIVVDGVTMDFSKFEFEPICFF